MLEYDFETLPMNDDEKRMAQMGLVAADSINTVIKDVINKRAVDGWQPLYPFSVPDIWFFRSVTGLKSKKINAKRRSK